MSIAGAAGPAIANAAAQTLPPRSAGRKIRVGAMNVGEYTFWGIWADILSSQGGMGTSVFNMEVTHCWDVNPKLAAEFAAKYGCATVSRYDDLVGRVDAIAFGGIYEVPWQHGWRGRMSPQKCQRISAVRSATGFGISTRSWIWRPSMTLP